MTDNRTPRRIQSVQTAFKILEILRNKQGASVTEVANEIDKSAGTVHTYLATMEDEGYVKNEDGVYQVGLFALPLGEYVRSQSQLYAAGKPVVDKLTQETGEAGHLVVESHGREILLYEQFGPDAVGEDIYTRIKGYPQQNLHCSAASKAILAHLDQSHRDRILSDYELISRTSNTITDEAVLRDELQQIRNKGFASNDEEQIMGVRAVAAPIIYNDTVSGAISISAPKSRMQDKRFTTTVPEQIIDAANIIEVNIQAHE
jgi:DNA-binding IclR family transcriptional regulator